MNLSQYGGTVGNPLGYIGWYSVSEPNLTAVEVDVAAVAAGIGTEGLPKTINPGDAFRRACTSIDRSNKRPIRLAHNMNGFYTFMVRKVTTTASEIVMKLMYEEVDEQDRTLDHIETATLTFSKRTEKLKVEFNDLTPLISGDDIRERSVNTINELKTRFAHCKKHYDAQAIRQLIRTVLDRADAVQVRARGGIYFIPVASQAHLEKLNKFVTMLGPGSVLEVVPLPDTTKQREMVRAAFDTEIHEQSSRLIADIKGKRADKASLTVGAWDRYVKKYNVLTDTYKSYSELLSDEMEQAKVELQALNNNIMSLMNDGLVKTAS